MTATIGSLYLALRADKTKLPRDIAEGLAVAEGEVDAAAARMNIALAKVGVGLRTQLDSSVAGSLGPTGAGLSALGPGGVAAAAGIAAFGLAAKASIGEFTDLAKTVEQFRRISGASTEDSSRFVAALDDLGVSSEAGAQALKKLAQNADSGAFAKLGIDVAKTKSGATDLVGTFENVLEKIRGIGDPVQRANVIMASFGRSGEQLGRILDLDAEGFKKLLKANEGQVLSKEDIQRAADFKLALNNLNDVVKEVEISFGRLLLPSFTEGIKDLGAVADALDRISRFKAPDLGSLGKSLLDLGGASFILKRFEVQTWDAGNTIVNAFKRMGEAAGTVAPELTQDLTKIAKAALDASLAHYKLADATIAVTNAQDALRTDQAELARLGGVGAQASIDAAEKSLAAAQAKQTEINASKAIADAKRNEQTVSVAANKAIAAAQKQANDEAEKRPGLLRAVLDAERSAANAAGDLADASKAVAKAQEDYKRTIGVLPSLLDDVTKAMRDQFDAADQLASLNDDLAANSDRLAKAQQALAQFDATGQATANDKAAGLKLAAQDAQDALDDAKAKAAAGAQQTFDAKGVAQKTPLQIANEQRSNLADLAKAQLAFNSADRDYRQQAADILDITDQRADLVRQINQLEREHNKLVAESLPDAQKAQALADARAKAIGDGTTPGAGFGFGSPEEQAAAKTQADAEGQAATAGTGVNSAVQGVLDAQKAVSQNTADTKTAFAAIATAINQAATDRTAALNATLGVLSDEKFRVAQAAIDAHKSALELSQLPVKVAGALSKVLADAINLAKAQAVVRNPIPGTPGLVDPNTGGAAGAGPYGPKVPAVSIVVHNPVAEPAGQSIHSQMTKLGALGVLPRWF